MHGYLQKWNIFRENNAIIDETHSDVYSIKSIKWLKHISHVQNINIKHACNGGEQTINVQGKALKVDGIHENTVYQFHGCFYHGCPKCYNETTLK